MLSTILKKMTIFSKQVFSINNFDNHLILYVLGLRIRKKLPVPEINTDLFQPGLNTNNRDVKIIASLTSFPERISIVQKTIRTLLKQTVKPDFVILWLAEEQFPHKEQDLPQELLELQHYGLTIKWCNDTKSYKKLIPALKEFPNDIIITFDDDIYYPSNVIEVLYNEYLKNKKNIYTNRSRWFYLKNNQLTSKTSAEMYWTKNSEASFFNKITGCGGVLYPPNSLDTRVFDEVAFRKIIPTQDDVWFWAMAVLNRTKIQEVAGYSIQLVTVEHSQQYGLSKINAKNNLGIDSLDASCLMIEHYPEIMNILKEGNCE